MMLRKYDPVGERLTYIVHQGRRKVCKGGAAESCYEVALPCKARKKFRILVSQLSKFSCFSFQPSETCYPSISLH